MKGDFKCDSSKTALSIVGKKPNLLCNLTLLQSFLLASFPIVTLHILVPTLLV